MKTISFIIITLLLVIVLYAQADDSIKQAQEYEQIARNSNSVWDYERAVEAYKLAGNTSKAAEMLEKVGSKYQNDSNYLGAASCYLGVIHLYNQAGEHDKANQVSKDTASIFEQAGMELEKAKDYMTAAWYYGYATNGYKLAGNTVKANEMIEKDASAYEQHAAITNHGNDPFEDPQDVGYFYIQAGNRYKTIGKTNKAIEMYINAIQRYTKDGQDSKASQTQAMIDALQRE